MRTLHLIGIFAIPLLFAGNAAAGSSQSAAYTPRDTPISSKPSPDFGHCVKIGSNIWECEYCWELEDELRSVCEKHFIDATPLPW